MNSQRSFNEKTVFGDLCLSIGSYRTHLGSHQDIFYTSGSAGEVFVVSGNVNSGGDADVSMSPVMRSNQETVLERAWASHVL